MCLIWFLSINYLLLLIIMCFLFSFSFYLLYFFFLVKCLVIHISFLKEWRMCFLCLDLEGALKLAITDCAPLKDGT